jgi:hypothetical protein
MTLSGRCAKFCAGFVLTVGCMTAPAMAQNAPPFDTTAQQIPSTAVIDSWVDAQVKDMASGERDKVVAARNALSLPGTPNDKSNRFVEVYGKAVGAKLLGIAGGTDAHARLNAAIVAGRVADMGATSDIIPLVVKLIGDDSPGVALYGIRASSSMLPRALGEKVVGSETLVPAIAAAMKRHSKSEAIVSEAYMSLIRVLSANNLAAQLPPNTVTAATPRIIDGLLLLMQQRLPAFGSGELVEPMAESTAIVFLAKTSSWAAMNPQTQLQTVKTLLAVANGAVKELEVEFNRKPTPNRQRLTSLQRLLKEAVGQSLSVIGAQVKNPALTAEAEKLKAFNSLTPPAQWELAVKEITSAFSKAFNTDAAPVSQPAK